MMESSGLAVLVLPPDGLETEVSYMCSQPCLHDSEGSGNQGSSELSWLAILLVLSNIIARKVSVVHDSMGRGQLEALLAYTLLSWTLPQTPLLLADF